MDRYDIGITAKDKTMLLAGVLMLRGAGFTTDLLFNSNRELPNSVHIRLENKSTATGTGSTKKEYILNGYSKGWFNLDDVYGLRAFSGTIAEFAAEAAKPKQWRIGEHTAVAEPANKRVVAGCTIVSLKDLQEMVAALEGK